MPNITKDQFWNALNEPEPEIINNSNGGEIYHWYNENRELHRENDLPAVIQYSRDGSICIKSWYQNGKCHRICAPAIIWYDNNGYVYKKCWCQNNEYHRISGPARIWYNKDGSIDLKHWYLNGYLYSEKQYWEKLKEAGYE